MANLAASGVTIERVFREGGLLGKERLKMIVSVVLSSMGTTTNKIPASAFGLQKIEECSNLVKSDNTVIVVAVPSADGSLILLANLAQATDANRSNPADLTGTFRLTVAGYE